MPGSRKSHDHVFTRALLSAISLADQSGVLHTKQRRQRLGGSVYRVGPIFWASEALLPGPSMRHFLAICGFRLSGRHAEELQDRGHFLTPLKVFTFTNRAFGCPILAIGRIGAANSETSACPPIASECSRAGTSSAKAPSAHHMRIEPARRTSPTAPGASSDKKARRYSNRKCGRWRSLHRRSGLQN